MPAGETTDLVEVKLEDENRKDGLMDILMFINPRSGGRQGEQLLKKLEKEKHPNVQIFIIGEFASLSQEERVLKLKPFKPENTRAVVAGGDGSQLWVVGLLRPIFPCSFAVLPLGTGNELGRVTGWGNGFGKLPKMDVFFKAVRHAKNVINVDQWHLTMKLKRHVDILKTPSRVFHGVGSCIAAYHELLEKVGIPEDKKDEQDTVEELILAALAENPNLKELAEKARTVETNFVLFFSLGFDAKIANRFHELREKDPEKKRSRGANKAWHGVYGAQELFKRTRNLKNTFDLNVNDHHIAMPKSVGTLQIFSVHSSSDGIYFWGKTKSKKEELQEYTKPYINDGLLEVVATKGVFHLVSIRSGGSHSTRIAQGANIELEVKEAVHAQIEGEPWLQQPCDVSIRHYSTVPILRGPGKVRNVQGEDRDVGDEVGICSKVFPCCCAHYEAPAPRNMEPAENAPEEKQDPAALEEDDKKAAVAAVEASESTAVDVESINIEAEKEAAEEEEKKVGTEDASSGKGDDADADADADADEPKVPVDKAQEEQKVAEDQAAPVKDEAVPNNTSNESKPLKGKKQNELVSGQAADEEILVDGNDNDESEHH